MGILRAKVLARSNAGIIASPQDAGGRITRTAPISTIAVPAAPVQFKYRPTRVTRCLPTA